MRKRKIHRTKDHAAITDHAEHGQCCKRMEVRIIIPGQKDIRHRMHAKPGQYMTWEGMQSILEQEASSLEKNLPQYEFRLVELAPNRFNLIGELKASPQGERNPGGATHAPIDSPASAAFPEDAARSEFAEVLASA